MEFFNFDELSSNIYNYRHDFNENNGRFFTIDYLLFTVQIVQPLQRADVPKNIKRIVEPTIISLNASGSIQSKGSGPLLKSSKEQRTTSVMKTDVKRIPSVLKTEEKIKSPDQRSNGSRENTSATTRDTQMPSWDPFSDEPRVKNLKKEFI
jgi:hypothetical protein